jgi:trehalose synthase
MRSSETTRAHVTPMQEVEIEPLQMDRFSDLLPVDRIIRFADVAAEARSLTRGRVIWNVNATAHGGGVAEMLQTLLAYVRGVHVDTRWLVLTGNPQFFTVTKRVHNMLHGEPGDGGALGAAEHAVVTEALAPDIDDLLARISVGDVVLLHDPQTAGMVDRLRAAGALVVWRCHVGRDTSNELTDRAWNFLRPLVQHADAFVFSRSAYVPAWCPPEAVRIITPSIDPLSAKNRPLSDALAKAALVRSGILEPGDDSSGEDTSLQFVRRDGRVGEVRRHRGLLAEGEPVPAEARLVVQVSRWDHLKDMAGVQQGFIAAIASLPDDVHLVLAGPEVTAVSDDPEGAAVLAECRDAWRRLGPAERRRVHLVCLPMDDVDENAHLVNALQRRATIVVQKSLVEGFGLTVTEAMWKGRPVVASAVGGIEDQITDMVDGVLLRDPTDVQGLGDKLTTLLGDPGLCAALGVAGRQTVFDRFLGDRHLEAYVDLVRWLLR